MSHYLDDLVCKLPFQINGYKFNYLIDKRSVAYVFQVTQLKTNQQFAAKVFNCPLERQKKFKSNMFELKGIACLAHPNIISFYDYFEEGNFMFFIFEYCSKGTIGDYLRIKNQFTEKQMVTMMRQLLQALFYCHVQNITHNNIKPSNIFISDSGVVKLGDFKLSICDIENKNYFSFKAPELINNNQCDLMKADVWSLGVTFYYMATGGSPWSSNREEAEKMIQSGKLTFPEGIPMEVENIIKQMIVVDSSERPTVEQLLKNKCFQTTNMLPNISRHNKNITRQSKNVKNICPIHGKSALPLLKMKRNMDQPLAFEKKKLKSKTVPVFYI